VPQEDCFSRQEKDSPLAFRSRVFGAALLAFVSGLAASASAATSRDVPFHIEAQALSEALREFTAQSGVRVQLDEALLQDRRSDGLQGSYTPDEALQKLLAAAGLTAKHLDATTVAVERADPREIGSVSVPMHTSYLVSKPDRVPRRGVRGAAST
jgi:iron complex outermembrane receptor protein